MVEGYILIEELMGGPRTLEELGNDGGLIDDLLRRGEITELRIYDLRENTNPRKETRKEIICYVPNPKKYGLDRIVSSKKDFPTEEEPEE
jgi:hypothetical protein